MINILHTSDWHIGKHLYGWSRLEEQKQFLEELLDIVETRNIHLIVVAGDIFDVSNPSAEALELTYKYLKKLTLNGKRPVIAIAGNHDNSERINAPEPLARECGIIFSGYPNDCIAPFSLDSGLEITKSDVGFIELKIPEVPFPVRVLLSPYANEIRLKTCFNIERKETELADYLQLHWKQLADKYCDNNGVNILASHLLFNAPGQEPPKEDMDEKSILYIGGAPAISTEKIPSQIQYVALGHLHRNQQITSLPCPVVYSGSPLAYSFSEALQNKYVVKISAQPDRPVITSNIALSSGLPLHEKRFLSTEAALEWLLQHQNCFVEITVVSNTYLSAATRKQLNDAHPRIVNIIPEIITAESVNENNEAIKIHQQKTPEEFFIEFFKYKTGQSPNENLIAIFKEAMALNKEEM